MTDLSEKWRTFGTRRVSASWGANGNDDVERDTLIQFSCHIESTHTSTTVGLNLPPCESAKSGFGILYKPKTHTKEEWLELNLHHNRETKGHWATRARMGISKGNSHWNILRSECVQKYAGLLLLVVVVLAVLTAAIQNSFIDVAAKLMFTLQESPYDQTGQKTWLHNVQVEDD